MELNEIRVDQKREEDGVWVDIDGETQILVARMYNPKFNARLGELTQKHRALGRTGINLLTRFDSEEDQQAMTRLLAETILLNWKGLKCNGQEITYSTNECIRVLGDPAYIEFRRFVVEMANDAANFRLEEIADSVGKSSAM